MAKKLAGYFPMTMLTATLPGRWLFILHNIFLENIYRPAIRKITDLRSNQYNSFFEIFHFKKVQ